MPTIDSLKRFAEIKPRGGVTNGDKAEDVRAQYKERFGVQAPPFDPSRPKKYWVDPEAGAKAPSDLLEYLVFSERTGTLQPIQMKAVDAATVNLPGIFVYPRAAYPSTTSEIDGKPIAPSEIMTREEATALSSEIGGDAVVESESNAIWRDERRYFQIRWRGKLVSAKILREAKNNSGLGSPGTWELSGSDPLWIPQPESDNGVFAVAYSSVPCRPLAAHERIERDGLAGVWIVKDTRIVPPPVSVLSTPSDARLDQMIIQMAGMAKQLESMQNQLAALLDR